MPTWEITNEETGQTLEVTGDKPPTPEDIEAMFAEFAQPTLGDRAATVGRNILGIPEVAAQGATGFLAQIPAGMAGISNALQFGPSTIPTPSGADSARAVQDFFTFEPRSAAAQELQGNIAKVAEPIDLAIDDAVVATGDEDDVLGQTMVRTALEAAAQFLPLKFFARRGGSQVAIRPDPTKPAKIPDAASIRKLADKVYKDIDNAGIAVSDDAYRRMLTEVEAAGRKKGMRKRSNKPLMKSLKDAVDDIERNPDGSIPFAELEGTRQNIMSMSQRKGQSAAGGAMIEQIDDFLARISPDDLVAGTTDQAATIFKARKLWSTMRKAEELEDLVFRARNAVGANFTQAKIETALRQQFRALADNKKRFNRFSPDEQAAILQVVRGSGNAANLVRRIGGFAPRGVISTGAIGALYAFNPLLGAIAHGGTELASRSAIASTRRNVSAAERAVRGIE